MNYEHEDQERAGRSRFKLAAWDQAEDGTPITISPGDAVTIIRPGGRPPRQGVVVAVGPAEGETDMLWVDVMWAEPS
jgi:hypothetical protein